MFGAATFDAASRHLLYYKRFVHSFEESKDLPFCSSTTCEGLWILKSSNSLTTISVLWIFLKEFTMLRLVHIEISGLQL